ncbi:MAG: archaetidylserine decarboxylase [Bdellovibrionales bacterium]
MKKYLFLILYVVPKRVLSQWVGFLVHLRLPRPLRTYSIRKFANTFNINLDEAEHPIQHYRSIGDFFVRRLKPGVRPLSGDDVIHPVDAVISQSSKIIDGELIQAKGKNYQLAELLGSVELAQKFENPVFATYYLCPTDYHRIHFPFDCQVQSANYLPGKLWPVNEWSVENIRDLFSINERVVVEVERDQKPAAMVLVGATNVGRISLSFDKTIESNREWFPKKKLRTYENLFVKKGDELGAFHMGSTVVVVYDGEEFSKLTNWAGKATQLGQSLS